MEKEYPKRLFRANHEPEVEHINNSCRFSFMQKIESVLPIQYHEVKSKSVFAHILSINDNGLCYSGRLIHSMMCRQLVTKKKHELWCVFGGRPLRFSLQEFYAITGLNCKDNFVNNDVENIEDDGGFWSNVLKRKTKISIKTLLDNHLHNTNNWSHLNKLRFVYVCVIAGLIVARDEKTHIPHKYIKLVMDINLVESYPWGREAFDFLVKSIIKIRGNLKKPKSYVLDGFSYAFQIWVMEAIPIIGELLGRKINEDLVEGPKCTNWTGAAKISYDDIIQLENTFKKSDVIYPYISFTQKFDIYELTDFSWSDELSDIEIDNLNVAIRAKVDFGDYIWRSVVDVDTTDFFSEKEDEKMDNEAHEYENEISAFRSKKMKKNLHDHGAESRKRQLLFQQASRGKQGGLDEETKSFIQEIVNASFSTLQKKIDKIDERMGKLESAFFRLQNSFVDAGVTNNSKTTTASKPFMVNDYLPNVVGVENKVLESLNLNDIHFSQGSQVYQNLDTQQFLQKTMGVLSQDTVVRGFDPMETYENLETNKISTPERFLFKEEFFPEVNTESSKLQTPYTNTNTMDSKRVSSEDDILVYVSETVFNDLMEWSNQNKTLMIGPTILNKELLTRVITSKEWFATEDMDAIMYLFRENTSLGRWKPDRVGFMNCMFGMQIKNEYLKFTKNRRGYKWSSFILAYGTGDLPSHGKTRKRWALDIDRIYTPLHVNGNHWISLCISFTQRTIEVFDCMQTTHIEKILEPLRVVIPRIVKAVQKTSVAKQLKVTPYSIIKTPVQRGLNKSCCDCGVYALKFIECHLHGLDISLMNDDNIQHARMKIAVDMWQAATDPIFIERMSTYEPTKFDDPDVVDIF